MMVAAQTAAGSVVSVDKSALFDAGASSDGLSYTTDSSGFNQKTFTLSTWFYLGKDIRSIGGVGWPLFSADHGSANSETTWWKVRINTSGQLVISNWNDVITTQVFRDIGWYHLVIGANTTQSTASDRYKVWVNGVRVTAFGTTNYPSQNIDLAWGEPSEDHWIGNYDNAAYAYNGYLAETVFKSGSQLDADSFGTYDTSGLYWTPKSSDDIKDLSPTFYLSNATDLSSNMTTFVDSGPTGHTITTGGNTTHSPLGHKVQNSVIYVDGTTDYISVAPSGHADFTLGTGDFCIEGWFNRIALSGTSNYSYVFDFRYSGNDAARPACYMDGSNNISYDVGSSNKIISTTDPSLGAWFHLAIARNSGTTTMYLNGTSVGSFSDSTDYLVGRPWFFEYPQSNAYCFNGYATELRISKGAARYTGNFTPSTSAFASDSNTSLLVHSNKDFGVANDDTGNGYNFVNTGAIGSSSHSPTNSYAVQNPLTITNTYPPVLSNGNLKQLGNSGGSWASGVLATLPCDGGGKFYWEAKCLGLHGTSSYIGLGVAPMDLPRVDHTDGSGNFVNPGNTGYQGGSILFNGASYTNLRSNNQSQDDNINSSLTIATNDFMQIAFDSSNGKLWYGKNNSWYNSGNPATGANPSSTLTATDKTWFPWFGTYTNSDIWQINYGASAFQYTPPTGFNKVNTTQIAEDTTRTASDTTKYFETTLYEGTGSEQNVVSDTTTYTSAFSWIKNRDANDPYMMFDRVRGATKDLHSDQNYAEVTNAQTVKAFIGGGVTLGTDAEVNTSSESFALWNWMIGTSGSGSSNEDGSINTTATLVDTTLGLSISKYIGTGSAATVGHGLTVPPTMMFIKNLGTTDSWAVYYGDNTDYLVLDTATGTVDDATMWNDTSPTSSVFTIGSNHQVNASSETYIAYCFANSQFISVGTFLGNENATGPFIPTINSAGVPIQPVWIMIKNSVQSRSWNVWDTARSPYNVSDKVLEADFASTESSGSTYYIDIDTGGFKIRGSHETLNGAETMIYMAIGTPIIDTAGRIIAGR